MDQSSAPIFCREANEFSQLESEDYGQVPYQKLQCRQSNYYLLAYLNLLDDDIIQDFLWVDGCAKLADRVYHGYYYSALHLSYIFLCSIYLQWCMYTFEELVYL